MIVQAYHVEESHGSVDVVRRAPLDLPLDRILAENLSSADLLGGHAPLASALDECPTPIDAQDHHWTRTIRWRSEAGEREIDGALAWRDGLGLIEFLLTRYLPGDDCESDRLVAAAQRGGELERRMLMRTMGRTLFRTRSSAERPYKVGIPVLSLRESGDDSAWPHADWIDGRLYWLPRDDEGAKLVISRPVERAIGRHRIPRLATLTLLPSRRPRRSKGRLAAWWFDGERHRFLRALEHLHARQLDDLDAHGRVHGATMFDTFPRPHLRVEAIVRVPTMTEAAALPVRRRRPRLAPLAAPAYIHDSRVPLEILPRTPVLADPAHGLWLLQHTIAGLYLPDDAASEWPPDRLGNAPQWLLVARPV